MIWLQRLMAVALVLTALNIVFLGFHVRNLSSRLDAIEADHAMGTTWRHPAFLPERTP